MRHNILIVDDDGPQRRSLRLGLELAGMSASEAASGEAALELLEEKRVTLAIIDVMMPETTGLQLVRRLRFRHASLPLILTSGYHLSREHLERLPPNVIAFVPKPYNLAELTEFLERKLGHVANG
jgi:DNA-binding NtrC family response regulator